MECFTDKKNGSRKMKWWHYIAVGAVVLGGIYYGYKKFKVAPAQTDNTENIQAVVLAEPECRDDATIRALRAQITTLRAKLSSKPKIIEVPKVVSVPEIVYKEVPKIIRVPIDIPPNTCQVNWKTGRILVSTTVDLIPRVCIVNPKKKTSTLRSLLPKELKTVYRALGRP